MKLQLNKEYVLRHVGVAALTLGISLWSAYDGFWGYPKANALWEQRTGKDAVATLRSVEEARAKGVAVNEEDLPPYPQKKIDAQFYMALFLAGVSLVIAVRVALETVHRFDFLKEDVKKVDFSKWESKRMAYVILSSGKVVPVDGWHFAGVPDFLASMGHPVPESQV